MSERPPRESILRRVYAVFLAAFAVTVVAAFIALRTIHRAEASSDWVNRTHGLIYELDGMRSSLDRGEGMMRSYALSGDPRDLAEAQGALAAITEHAGVAEALLREDPAAVQAFARLNEIAEERIALAESLRAARQAGREADLAAPLQNDPGLARLAEFRRGVDQLRDRQFELLSERDRESFRQAHATRWIVGIGVGLNLVLLLGVAWLIGEDIRNRRRLAAALQAANESLEAKVKERTAELTAANRRLTLENRERQWTLASQEHQLRYNQVIINSLNELVLVLTKTLNITRVNPAVAHRTGFADERLLGQPLASLLTLEPGEGSFERLERALKDGRESATPAILTDSQGRRHAVRLSLVPLRDRDAVVGAVAIVAFPA
jgi:PAS domain S-box-containing protein